MRASYRLTLGISIIGPVSLMVGWTVAADLQPPPYDQLRDTISALAATGAADRWLMTTALYLLGLSYLGSACRLDRLRRRGRIVLALGGISTLLVASFPQPRLGQSYAHTAAATVAFGALAIWPLLAMPSRSPLTAPFRRWSFVASAVMVTLVLWFVLDHHGANRGLVERLAAGSESLWPVVAALVAPIHRIDKRLLR